ncbi:uncharacterized protein [Centruroides vittatus]|uniref:uncharacterized protein n=1 Tax=Centruroides vittatus TaxID=120091 RepID=UPI00350F36C5
MRLFLISCLVLYLVTPSLGKGHLIKLLKAKKHLKYILPFLLVKAMNKPKIIPVPVPIPIPVDKSHLTMLKSSLLSRSPSSFDVGWKFHKEPLIPIVPPIEAWAPKKEIIIIAKSKKEIPEEWDNDKWEEEEEKWDEEKWENIKWKDEKPKVEKWKGWKKI